MSRAAHHAANVSGAGRLLPDSTIQTKLSLRSMASATSAARQTGDLAGACNRSQSKR